MESLSSSLFIQYQILTWKQTGGFANIKIISIEHCNPDVHHLTLK